LMRMASRLQQKLTYAANAESKNADADCTGVAITLRPEIKFSYTKKADVLSSGEIVSCLSGDYNFDNIMAAVCIAGHFALDHAQIKKGIEKYEPKNNRSQVIRKTHNTIYMDAYNANPSSMEASLRNFAAMPFEGKIAIIGDMFELGKYAEEEHKNMIRLCEQLALEDVILVGEEFVRQNTSAYKSFHTTGEAIAYLKEQNLSEKNIFMKGSRGMKLESIAEVIQ
jgi:UDP-N-acetylmuramoyl-tripeptide--D-alanyl-D-alanine ligase